MNKTTILAIVLATTATAGTNTIKVVSDDDREPTLSLVESSYVSTNQTAVLFNEETRSRMTVKRWDEFAFAGRTYTVGIVSSGLVALLEEETTNMLSVLPGIPFRPRRSSSQGGAGGARE